MTESKAYTNVLTALAARVVAAVHAHGPAGVASALADARALTAPRGVDADGALAVVLAAMVDPTRAAEDLTAWTACLDGGAAYLLPESPRYYRVNEQAVGMALAGALPAAALNPAELADVVSVLSQHMSPDDIALHLGAEVAHVRRWTSAAPVAAA